ncbi:hypothetical protein F442_12766 [Phytophthora nicotianae P10297]|uniref:Uncharacterized protein n=1 Tax=Phytophthora nicotianae P10297 TaxID=1317064 RepID=W2YYC5_PHYNI|nr:hypothetical protein F442_12766 [Phytophthora nicotianae P10297]
MESYVRNISPANWVLYRHVDINKPYKWRTTNSVESENGRALLARELNPSEFFTHYMELFTKTKYKRWEEATAWLKVGKIITEYAEAMYQKRARKASLPLGDED